MAKINDGDIIEMLENYDLPDIYQHKLSLIKGEKYTLRKNLKAEREYNKKNWWVVGGKYFNKDKNDIQQSSLIFTSKEFKDIIKISKNIIQWN